MDWILQVAQRNYCSCTRCLHSAVQVKSTCVLSKAISKCIKIIWRSFAACPNFSKKIIKAWMASTCLRIRVISKLLLINFSKILILWDKNFIPLYFVNFLEYPLFLSYRTVEENLLVALGYHFTLLQRISKRVGKYTLINQVLITCASCC